MEAWGSEHVMLVGRAFQVKYRDKMYPVLEASKLYVNSRKLI